jgi:hypothetical protein
MRHLWVKAKFCLVGFAQGMYKSHERMMAVFHILLFVWQERAQHLEGFSPVIVDTVALARKGIEAVWVMNGLGDENGTCM